MGVRWEVVGTYNPRTHSHQHRLQSGIGVDYWVSRARKCQSGLASSTPSLQLLQRLPWHSPHID